MCGYKDTSNDSYPSNDTNAGRSYVKSRARNDRVGGELGGSTTSSVPKT